MKPCKIIIWSNIQGKERAIKEICGIFYDITNEIQKLCHDSARAEIKNALYLAPWSYDIVWIGDYGIGIQCENLDLC